MEPDAAIVMDNAVYRSRRLEKLPTSIWRRTEIINWLKSKKIEFDRIMLKPELLKIREREKSQYIKYVVDEMAAAHGITACHHTTDVKSLLHEINLVTAETWSNCIMHVHKEEQCMWDLDMTVDELVDLLIIFLSSSDEDDSSSDDNEGNKASDQ
ncbi:uncharacterized protein LOC108917160 [Anoplophora glabripennis]|uniref:uncharacterized protein LOC108917160 n=1 Tax=Anoplophora glabripennis TaxID=217634 RepID=UPI00087533CC|nr:uncharacterized protein LOC108917160 [Anoplophora glabripennis]